MANDDVFENVSPRLDKLLDYCTLQYTWLHKLWHQYIF